MKKFITAVQNAINEYGIENISMVSYNRHGFCEDDDYDFTYYNNVTGEFFDDIWTIRFSCPNLSCYMCQTLKEADQMGYIDRKKLFKIYKNTMLYNYYNFNITMYDDLFEQIASFGLRVEVKGSNKWNGIGFLVDQFTITYNRYTIIHYAKIYDPITNRIETVNAKYVNFLDFNNIVEKFKSDMIAIIEATTVDNLQINNTILPFNSKKLFTNQISININCNIKSFFDYLKENRNILHLDNAVDVLNKDIKYINNNINKTSKEDIMKYMFNKQYI